MNVQRVRGPANVNFTMQQMAMKEQMMAQAFMQNQMAQAEMMRMAVREA